MLKYFLALRPTFHYTEKRVRGRAAICVLAAVPGAVMSTDLKARKFTRPRPRRPAPHRTTASFASSSGSGWSASVTRPATNVGS